MIHLPKLQPAPAPLKRNGIWSEETIERLEIDFKNKCYICEEKEITSINVEHFKPHKADEELASDWNNLFLSCGHCNNTKLAKPEFDKLLNCTETDEVETKIRYHLNPFPKEKVEITALENTESVINTSALLNAVYNGATASKKLESANLRKKLLAEINKFGEELLNYTTESNTNEERESIRQRVEQHLSCDSHFTAFKRWIVRNDTTLLDEFSTLLNENKQGVIAN